MQHLYSMKQQIIIVLSAKLRRVKGTESQQELAPLRTIKIDANNPNGYLFFFSVVNSELCSFFSFFLSLF